MSASALTSDERVELLRLIKQTKSANDLHVEFRTQHPDCNPRATREALALDSLLSKLANIANDTAQALAAPKGAGEER